MAETVTSSRCSAEESCCVVGETCPVCTAVHVKKKRVRRNLRTTSEAKYIKIAAAINALKAKTSGKNYDYFVAKQMAAFYDSRGIQSDFGAHFITWHTLFLLEFEVELLKIDKSIGALPYWDWGNGEFPTFPTQFVGLLTGLGENFQINRGAYANFPIGPTNQIMWKRLVESRNTTPFATLPRGARGSYIAFNGETASGKLRNKYNLNTNPRLTRRGPYTFRDNGLNGCITYNETDVLERRGGSDCAENSRFPHMEWYSCMEGKEGFSGPPWNNVSIIRTPLYYAGSNLRCARFDNATDPAMLNLKTAGDLKDPASSANDPLFWFHMSNMVRLHQQWMRNNTDAVDVYYGYPLHGARWEAERNAYTMLAEGDYQGIGLAEPVSHHWGFQDADLGVTVHLDDPSAVWTHADVLCHLGPKGAPYTYDMLVPPPEPIPEGTPIISPALAQTLFTVAVVLMITVIGTLEMYRWQYNKADRARYAPVQNESSAEEGSEDE